MNQSPCREKMNQDTATHIRKGMGGKIAWTHHGFRMKKRGSRKRSTLRDFRR